MISPGLLIPILAVAGLFGLAVAGREHERKSKEQQYSSKVTAENSLRAIVGYSDSHGLDLVHLEHIANSVAQIVEYQRQSGTEKLDNDYETCIITDTGLKIKKIED